MSTWSIVNWSIGAVIKLGAELGPTLFSLQTPPRRRGPPGGIIKRRRAVTRPRHLVFEGGGAFLGMTDCFEITISICGCATYALTPTGAGTQPCQAPEPATRPQRTARTVLQLGFDMRAQYAVAAVLRRSATNARHMLAMMLAYAPAHACAGA